MVNSVRASIGIMLAALAGAVFYLIQILPLWVAPSVLIAMINMSLVLIVARKPFGFSLAQVTLFCGFLVGMLFIVGDPESLDPRPRYTTVSPYVAVAAASFVFLACAAVLRKAKTDMHRALAKESAE